MISDWWKFSASNPITDHYSRLSPSLDGGELLYINTLGPLLERGGLLLLRFDLQEIALRHHDPKGAVFAFVLEGLEAGITIDRDGFGIAFRRCRAEIPCC